MSNVIYGNQADPINVGDKIYEIEVDFVQKLPDGVLLASIAGIKVTPTGELVVESGGIIAGLNSTNTAVLLYLTSTAAVIGTDYSVEITGNLDQSVNGVTAQLTRKIIVPIRDV